MKKPQRFKVMQLEAQGCLMGTEKLPRCKSLVILCCGRLLSSSRQVRRHLWYKGPAEVLLWDSKPQPLTTPLSWGAGFACFSVLR